MKEIEQAAKEYADGIWPPTSKFSLEIKNTVDSFTAGAEFMRSALEKRFDEFLELIKTYKAFRDYAPLLGEPNDGKVQAEVFSLVVKNLESLQLYELLKSPSPK